MNFKKIDYKILFIIFLLFIIGIFSIGNITETKDKFVEKQILWFFLSLSTFVFTYSFGYHRLIEISPILYIFTLGLLLLVLTVGPIKSGAQRWLNIWGLNFQPAEFAKIALILTLARYYLFHKDEIKKTKIFIVTLAITIPYLILIFLQPDLGSAFVLLPIFVATSLIGGVKKRNLVILLIIGILLSPLLWSLLKDYQKQRILVFINPNLDPLGAGYTIIQSKIAIGSGRLLGEFWFGGKNSFGFLPESHTDFIFANICENFGFLGGIFIILLYYLLLQRILKIGNLTNNLAGKIISIGIAAMLFSHIFINMGMCLGILPVVGIPLPFISYGGSNLLANTVALGIVNSIEKEI